MLPNIQQPADGTFLSKLWSIEKDHVATSDPSIYLSADFVPEKLGGAQVVLQLRAITKSDSLRRAERHLQRLRPSHLVLWRCLALSAGSHLSNEDQSVQKMSSRQRLATMGLSSAL